MKKTNNITSSYFTTGKFAKICNTTKNTLFHYDEIGLLNPSIIKDNGYRYYTVDQIYTYDIINILKNCNCSLKEIKSTLENNNINSFFSFIEDKKISLLEQRARIDKAIHLLDQSYKITTSALQGEVNKPFITKLNEDKHIIATKCNPTHKLNNQEIASTLNNHFSMCDNLNCVNRFPLGYIILQQTYNSGELHHAYIYSNLREPLLTDNSYFDQQIIVKKGTYLNIKHKGTYETIGNAYQELLSYAYINNLQLCSDIYEENLISYFATSSEDDHIIHIFVMVSPPSE